jgi:hypothetical protein
MFRGVLIVVVTLIWKSVAMCDDAATASSNDIKGSVNRMVIYFEDGGSYNLQDLKFPRPKDVNITANDAVACKGTMADYLQPSYLSGSLPDKKVNFGKGVNSACMLEVVNRGTTNDYSLLGQELGLLSRESQTNRIPILCYENCPVFIDQTKKLNALSDLVFQEPHIITIASAKDNLLQATGSTPFYVGFKDLTLSGSAANAQNVIWRFAEKGISFSAGGVQYTSSKEGAEIRFTKDGPALTDITAQEKSQVSTKK